MESSQPPTTLGEGDFMQLLMQHDPALRAFERSLLPDWQMVDEVIQEASVTAWEKSSQVDGEEPGLVHAFASDSHPESPGPALRLQLAD